MASNGRGGRRNAGGGGDEDQNNGNNRDRSRSPIRGDRTPPEAPAGPQTGIPTSTNRGPPALSPVASFLRDYESVGEGGKRLFFRVVLEGLAQLLRTLPPVPESPKFDMLMAKIKDWDDGRDEDERSRERIGIVGLGHEWVDEILANVRTIQPPGEGIIWELAAEWPITTPYLRDEFLKCMTDARNHLVQVLLNLPEPTKDLFRRLEPNIQMT